MSVRYATESLGATPGRDYTHVSGILTFAVGQAARSISVPVVGDRVEERDEFFKLVLRYPTGGLYLDRTEALGWIVNDDFVGPPKVSISDASLVEGDAGSTGMVFTVRLSRVVGQRPERALLDRERHGRERARATTRPRAGVVSFPIGVTERTIVVPVLGDVTDEADETFFVNLGPARGVSYLDRQGKGTIVERRSVTRTIHEVVSSPREESDLATLNAAARLGCPPSRGRGRAYTSGEQRVPRWLRSDHSLGRSGRPRE